MVITEVELLVVEKQLGQELVLLTVKTDAWIEGHAMGWGIVLAGNAGARFRGSGRG